MSDDQPPSNTSSSSSASSETGYNFTSDPWIRWRNTFRYLTGQLTEEGNRQYKQGRDERFAAADCKRCEDQRDYLLQYSPIVRFMHQKINDLGGDLHGGNIRCMKCSAAQGGGLHPDYGIMLCANRPEPLEDTLTHEMVHAYDYLRFKVNFETHDLRHAACTEIRASSLSGECRFWREFWHRAQWKVMYQHQECVKRRATLSVSARPNCRDDVEAAKVVNEVWDSCFADTRPFDEIYK